MIHLYSKKLNFHSINGLFFWPFFNVVFSKAFGSNLAKVTSWYELSFLTQITSTSPNSDMN